MWFRGSVGNGTGDGATITVTYSSQFYNKTMTCTKGTKTYTKITTSSGSTVFDVDESGTWTITCNGTSRTVDVVLEYSTQMSITKTITVYGAASDTVSFTDMTGAKTVTTNASGRGSVNITFIPPSANITFTSSKAKNPNNLSQAYSKTVTISTNTTAIYVMPNSALYWYGYQNGIEDMITANGWTWTGVNMTASTFNTNNIVILNGGIGTRDKVTGTLKALIKGVTAVANVYGTYGSVPNKVFTSADTTISEVTNNSLRLYTASISNRYGIIPAVNGRSMQISALWYE